MGGDSMALRVNALETRLAELERWQAERTPNMVDRTAAQLALSKAANVTLGEDNKRLRKVSDKQAEEIINLREDYAAMERRVHQVQRERDEIAEREDAKLDALNEIYKIMDPWADEIEERRD